MAREQKRHAKRQETTDEVAASGVPLPGSKRDGLPASPVAFFPETARAKTTTPAKRHVEDRILNALAVVADLLEHDEAYLPIFLRLEAELEKAKAQQSAFQRAKTFAQTRR
jgi:hypothetical protein